MKRRQVVARFIGVILIATSALSLLGLAGTDESDANSNQGSPSLLPIWVLLAVAVSALGVAIILAYRQA